MLKTTKNRPFTLTLERLREVGLRPTRQRMALSKLLFDNGDRHVTAEQLHAQAMDTGVRVSLATIYNTLHQCTEAGLLREVVVEPGRSYFDTNTSDHHHFLFEESGELKDIPSDDLVVSRIPDPPKGASVDRIDVTVRLRRN